MLIFLLFSDQVFFRVFGEHVSLEGVYPFRVYSFVCKPGVLKFGTVINMDKICHKSIIV